MRPSGPSIWFLLAPALLAFGCGTGSDPGGPPFDPEDALATFAVVEGFRVELLVAEPLVADPVAMEIDEHGRLYVVEMPGYPLDVGGSGRVRLLEDSDGDGRPDRGTTFADGLTLPTGVLRWKEGILVTDAPDVLYLEDTDGDGVADRREVVLTGFGLSNPQHNVNSPIYGLDNGIYLANEGVIRTDTYADLFGDAGAEVHFPARPDGPRLGRNGEDANIRFRPDTHELEALSSRSQFGHAFDAWGRYFLVNNANPQFHEVVAARYLRRNPDLPVRRAVEYTPAYGHGAAVYPITLNPEHQLLTDRGVFTSASGITYYLGGLFPEPYTDVAFVAESVHNLVHVDRVEPAGATFTADRVLEGREFLASTDAWFRPVNFYVGPDGALYVIDYYRQIVEHPEWMDDEVVASGDLYNGSDRGRIYRIVPQDAPPVAWSNALALGDAAPARLVEALAHENVWWRRTAQRLLVDRRPEEAVGPLVEMATSGASGEGRVHALWTLDGMGRLAPEVIARALTDPVAGVRENAIRLAERALGAHPGLEAALTGLAGDPDPRVRFQLLCTLGGVPTEAARAVRRQLLLRDMEDPWVQLAALAAPPGSEPLSFEQAVARFEDATPGRSAYVRRLAGLTGSSGTAGEVRRLLAGAAAAGSGSGAAWWPAEALEGLAEGIRLDGDNRAAAREEADRLLGGLFDGMEAPMRAAVLGLLSVTGLPEGAALDEAAGRARRLASDPAAEASLRADAVRVLSLAGADAHEAVFRSLIEPEEPAAVQRAAVDALGGAGGSEPAAFLLERWDGLTPEIREAAVDVFLRSEERAALLLSAVEEGRVLPATIGWGRRVRLMQGFKGAVRAQARALLSEPEGRRSEVVDRYRPALSRPGDAARGAVVFAEVCSACHRREGAGGAAFGPDLGTVRHWSAQALMEKILDPGRSTADGYALWLVDRRSGGTVTGIVAEETPVSVTLRFQGGAETVIPRADIEAIRPAGVSAMPAGLEGQIDERGMADLLAFLREG